MKTYLAIVGLLIVTLSPTWAQQPQAPASSTVAAPTTQTSTGGIGASLNKALGMYVFPAKNQNAATVEKDTQACYTWGKEQSGVDPLNPPDVKAEATEKGPDGSAVRGAAKGAVAGVAIGAIAGDAGKGAAIGAAAGGMGGAGGRRQRQQAEAQQAEKTAQSKEVEMMNSFKKAYAACLQGKGYTVN
jgi:hypothetical protein